MRDSGLKRWVVRGMLVSAACGMAACGVLPQQAGNDSFQPGFVRGPGLELYNGTIEQYPTSIDPRTPEKMGTQGRSLAMDRGEQALRTQMLGNEGVGGSGVAPMPVAPSYDNLGAMGTAMKPSNQAPAAMGLPEASPGPIGGRSGAMLRVK